MTAAERKSILRKVLIDAAERAVAAQGIAGIKARSLASEASCAVGAIYNVFADLDELALAVNARTLAALESELAAAIGPDREAMAGNAEAASDRLVQLAVTYLDFVLANKQRWRALFEFRLPDGKDVPEWYLADRSRLFGFIETPLRDLLPEAESAERAALARSLFSAVHGIVTLGLEERLGVVSLADLRAQTTLIVRALAKGLVSGAIARRDPAG